MGGRGDDDSFGSSMQRLAVLAHYQVGPDLLNFLKCYVRDTRTLYLKDILLNARLNSSKLEQRWLIPLLELECGDAHFLRQGVNQ